MSLPSGKGRRVRNENKPESMLWLRICLACSASSLVRTGSCLRISVSHLHDKVDDADKGVVRVLDLIPQYHHVNRMTLNAVMLSLGPSLNISGLVLTELLEKRSSLFASPPPITGTESANSIVDFGNTNITPPHLPAVLEHDPTLTASLPTEDGVPKTPIKAKRSPHLPNKPSITRLFSGSSGIASKKSSVDTMRSMVDITPPRVELPTSEPTIMPSFGVKEDESMQPVGQLKEAEKAPQSEDHSAFAAQVFGTTDGSRPLSTPIADMYQNNGSFFPPLRTQKSLLGLTGSIQSLPSVMSDSQMPRLTEVHSATAMNPATVIRRGPPVFFQSSGDTERHGRTPSGGPIGIKRKEDSPSRSSVSSGTEGINPSREKRLSAGPGPVSVREVVRTMEMTA